MCDLGQMTSSDLTHFLLTFRRSYDLGCPVLTSSDKVCLLWGFLRSRDSICGSFSGGAVSREPSVGAVGQTRLEVHTRDPCAPRPDYRTESFGG